MNNVCICGIPEGIEENNTYEFIASSTRKEPEPHEEVELGTVLYILYSVIQHLRSLNERTCTTLCLKEKGDLQQHQLELP